MNKKFMAATAVLLLLTQTGFAEWQYRAASPNAGKGDVILSRSSGSAVSSILEQLGQYWDHSMMVIDNGQLMRHNTMDEGILEDIIEWEEKNILIKIPPFFPVAKKVDIPKRLNPVKLSNGVGNSENGVGIITDSIRNKGNLLALLTISDESFRSDISEVADYMVDMNGYYIFHSYVDMLAYEPALGTERIYGQGGHCSGTIWWANHYAGKDMLLYNIDDDAIIKNCAVSLHNYISSYVSRLVKDYVYKDLKNAPEYLKKDIYRQIVRDDKYDVDDKLANQIVNTFLFNRSSDTGDFWKSNIGQVHIESVSPDHLLMLGMPNKGSNDSDYRGLYYSGNQSSSSTYYDAITDYSESGGYYYKNFEDGTASPPTTLGWVQLYNVPCDIPANVNGGVKVGCCE